MATACITTGYCHDEFHRIQSIHAASTAYHSQNAQSLIDATLSKLIVKHGVEESFGIGLVHRHFDILPDEILVEFNNISSPWCVQPGYGSIGGKEIGDQIYPIAWKIAGNDKWMPYEFAWKPQRTSDVHMVDMDNPKYQSFLEGYTAAIKGAGCQDLLGLRAWPGKGFRGVIEFTVGNMNINLQAGQYEDWMAAKHIGYIESMWFMAEEFKGANCLCVQSLFLHLHRSPKGDISNQACGK